MSPDAPKNIPWFVVSMVLIGVIGGFVLANVMNAGQLGSMAGNVAAPRDNAGKNQGPTPAPTPVPPPAGEVKPIDVNVDHIRGNPNADIAVIEYSDFECPFCKRVHPTYMQILEEYGDEVMWVYRHYPLGFHVNAQKEAEATDCASDQGGNDAFWQYTDAIFERTTSNGTGFPLDDLVPLAKEIGLDEIEFKDCLDSDKFAQHVKDDMAGGSAAGVRGTPGNIVYNIKTKESVLVSGAQPFENFKSAIDGLQ